MTDGELRMLTTDGAVEPCCPYCDNPGGTVSHAGHLMHRHCYDDLGRELAIFDTLNPEGETMKLDSVQVRTDEAEPLANGQEGYAIEDREGNVLGYTPSLYGPEQRAAIAKAMGVTESEIAYKGDDEDENGPVEVWGLVGVPVPVAS